MVMKWSLQSIRVFVNTAYIRGNGHLIEQFKRTIGTKEQRRR